MARHFSPVFGKAKEKSDNIKRKLKARLDDSHNEHEEDSENANKNCKEEAHGLNKTDTPRGLKCPFFWTFADDHVEMDILEVTTH